jgi:hypothetical protein
VSDVEALVLAAMLVPAVVLAIAAMVRGYHVKFKMYRPGKDDHDGQR